MADIRKKVPESVEGEFFVDSTCIDCDTCRQLAPEVFAEAAAWSYVHAQPRTAVEERAATRALLACPVGSIGTMHYNDAKNVMRDFPLPIDSSAGDCQVYYCGFNSPKSFGAHSYFVRHPQGNWLIDSPKFMPHLVRHFDAMGGLGYIFLTHRDDVAEASRYAQRFNARRIIHRDDLMAQPDSEIVIEGTEPIIIHPEFKIIPTPGHSPGQSVLLVENRYLFTGDHLWWKPDSYALGCSRAACWYSWPEQIASMRRLLDEAFEWVLPGHGARHHLPAAEMRQALEALVSRMPRQTREW